MTRKPKIQRAGAPSRWLPGWFVLVTPTTSRWFPTWGAALAYALGLGSEPSA